MSRLSSHAFNKDNNETTISALLLLPLLWQSYVDIYVYMQSRNIGQSHIACSFYPTMTPHLVLCIHTSNKECHHRYAGQHAVAVAVQMIPSFEVAYTVEN